MKGDGGKHYIFVCTGKSCRQNGSKALIKELKALKKKKVGIIKTKCMDYCKRGPNVIIKDNLYHCATAADILDEFED